MRRFNRKWVIAGSVVASEVATDSRESTSGKPHFTARHQQTLACLFGDDLARAPQFGREVFQLGQAVAHRKHGLGVIDMNAGLEFESRNRGREYVHESDRRVIGHQMTAALR